MIKKVSKNIINGALSVFDLELRKKDAPKPIEQMFDDPEEALLFTQGGKEAGFYCPTELCTHHTGIGFSKSDWNPFVETLREFEKNPNLKYEDSILCDFYNSWQPKSAAEMFKGFNNAPKELKTLPPHYMFLSPWSSLTPEEVDHDGRWWNNKDNAEHGAPQLRFPEDGWAFSGPVNIRKGRLEFNRLTSLYKNIKINGYDRSLGLIGTTFLTDDNESRFIIGGGGFHRAIVLASLDTKTIPARFHRASAVNINQVGKWPLVKLGIWSKQEATSYFNFLLKS
ncbi:hypothetical protein QWZ13_04485 [Reinekea marina]|uniref:Sulfatase-modifying factor enzyme 1 n=1 Tax=Reinekea marina TaxID=1310421 RepID=A0ABV7WT17_9GAMM|nr:hypothetical protein [Reinekea marina]MDN3648162.1 hypothetical protein [Reinekea marina]